MVAPALKRTLVSILVLIGSGLWVAALLIMAQTVQQSAHFSDLHPFIVGVNVAGLLVLLILIGGRVVQLIRDWRKRVVGSRLEARMVWMSATLAMVPLLLVFYFSVMFLNRGIDSWFHVEIREGLENALNLSKAALDLRRQEYMERTRTIANEIATRDDPVAALDDARRQYGAIELTLLGTNQRIIGTSSERFGQIVPSRPSDEMVMQSRQPYVTLDPVAGGGFLVRTSVPLPLTAPGDEPRMLEAVYPVERRLGGIADGGLHVGLLDAGLATGVEHQLLQLRTRQGAVGAKPGDEQPPGLGGDLHSGRREDVADHAVQVARLVGVAGDGGGARGRLEQGEEGVALAEAARLHDQEAFEPADLHDGLQGGGIDAAARRRATASAGAGS